MTTLNAHRFSVAPMIDVSDRHFRYLCRLLTRYTRLYTEMITTAALLHGQRARLLDFHPIEHPVALQLGGNDPAQLTACSDMARDAGYDEINLNCGCPSDRVQDGAFGACLMQHPERVRDCLRAMAQQQTLPVTLKCRTGLGRSDNFDAFLQFIDTATDSPCHTVILHARNAWLDGLSPKENRDIPPLKYDWGYRLKSLRPHLTVVLNGGITSLEGTHAHLQYVDGVMIGRAAWHNTGCLAAVDTQLFQDTHTVPDRLGVSHHYAQYCAEQQALGVPLGTLIKPLLGLWHEVPGARQVRRHLSEHAHRPGASASVILDALAHVSTIQPSGVQCPLG